MAVVNMPRQTKIEMRSPAGLRYFKKAKEIHWLLARRGIRDALDRESSFVGATFVTASLLRAGYLAAATPTRTGLISKVGG
jgi:hypothetical protein